MSRSFLSSPSPAGAALPAAPTLPPARGRARVRRVAYQVLVQALLLSFSALFLFPFLWMLSTALKTPQEMFAAVMRLIPRDPQWGNFIRVFSAIPFLRYTLNTAIITFGTMAGVLLSSSLVAYSFARLRWPGRNLLFVVLLSTLMLPGQVILIPTFILFSNLGWLDSFAPLVVPAFFGGGAFNIFLLRQFYRTIPFDLTESARIDGCREIHIYARIILPLCKPILATIALFTFMGCWNDFFGPLIFLTNPDLTTLALGLRAFQQQHTAQWDLMMAGALISALPTLVLFFSFQRYFVEGITLTGIKG